MGGVKDYYQQKRPPAQSLHRLIEMAEIADSERERTRRASRRAFAMAAVAAVLACAITFSGDLAGEQIPTTIVAQEIALSHEKDLALEFAGESYDELSERMQKLDFRPIAPTRVTEAASGRLLGGRYCSISGCIAAQLRLRSDDGRVHTLVQTRWSDDYDALLDRNVEVDGVRVTFWRERDVLFGLASND